MATYYVNSDLGKERVGSISKVGDRIQMSDGTWIKKTESGYSATKNGQSMDVQVGVSPSADSSNTSSSDNGNSSIDPTSTDPSSSASSTSSSYESSAQEKRDQEQRVAKLASEKAKEATKNVTEGLYTIGTELGMSYIDQLKNAGDTKLLSDGYTLRREDDGSYSASKGGSSAKVHIDNDAVKRDTLLNEAIRGASGQSNPYMVGTAKGYELLQQAKDTGSSVWAPDNSEWSYDKETGGFYTNRNGVRTPITADKNAINREYAAQKQKEQSAQKEATGNVAPPEQASGAQYVIGSALGVLRADNMKPGDRMQTADDTWVFRNEDGSYTAKRNNQDYSVVIDREAAQRDPQWAILTAPPAEDTDGTGKKGKKSSKKSSGSSSSGGSGTYTFPAASTGTQKTPTATATGTNRAPLRKQAATAQKEMGDLARQISVAKIRGKDTSALQAKYNEAKARYDTATMQINMPTTASTAIARREAAAEKNAAVHENVSAAYEAESIRNGLSTSGARQEQFSQRQTLMELATQQAAERKDAWQSLPTVRDSERFSNIDNVTTGRTRSAEQQQIAGAVKALQKDAWRSLPTVQDSERFRIPSQTDSLMQQAIAQRQSAAQPQTDKGIVGKLFTMLGAGLGQFNSSIANFADAAATAVETVESYLNGGFTKDGKFAKGDSAFTSSLLQPIHDWAKYTQSTSDSLNERSAANWSDTKAGSVANTIGTGVIAALPQAALALLTLGTSSAGTLTQTSSGLAGSIETVMRRISSDPSYWLSFMQETGGNFAEAKGAGATDEQAILASTIAGLANAAIEVGGGLENNNWMNDGTLSALSKAKNLIKGAIEEGGEELIQNPISRAMQKLVYDGDREWLSLDNTAQGRDAVFNPYQSAEEFATGAAVGGILGAGNFALNRALGSRSQNQAQNTHLTQDELLDAAMQAANRGETLTGPVQAANQTTQQTTQGTAERGAEGVITGSETNKNVPAYTETENTAVNDNPAVHTPQEQAVIEAYKDSVDENLAQFYQYAKNDQRAGKYTLNKVSERAADDIRNLTGQDVDGFKTTLDARQAWHINNDHGINGKSDHSMANDTDVARMQYVLDNYDNAAYGGTTDAYWEPKANGKNRRSPVVVFSKKVNGTYYVVEATPVTKAQSVYVVSAYMLEPGKTPFGRAGRNNTGVTTQLPDANASWFTANTDSANMTPNANVAQSFGPVNQNISANDMGAMRSQFESVPKQAQTQSNTINSMETSWDVPEAQRTPIMYDTISEAKSLDNARLRLAQDYAGEMAELRGKHNWSGEEVDMGMTILDNYRRAAEQTGDWTEYSNWRKEVSAHGTAAGQALQAYAKYSRQTGGGIVADASSALERAAKKTNKAEVMNRVSALAQQYDAAVGTGQENAKVNVNDLVDIIKSASTARQTGTLIGNKTPPIVNWAMNRIADYARAEAQSGGGENLDFLRTFAADSIYNIAADTRAVSAGEQVKTVRRMGMLSKVSTVMRNLVSNNVFDPIDSIARNVSVPLDMLVSTITGTRSVAGDASWFSAAKRKGSMDGLARACMEVGLDVDASGTAGKYENTSNRTFKMSGGVFSKLMSVWEAYEGYTLNATDEFQKGGIEASVQKGIDRLYEKGKITDDSLRNAGEQEALYRTFQDKTVLSDAAIGVRNALNKAHIGDIGAGDIMLPFAQVPSNLGARAIEYSPAGLGVAAADFINMIDSARKGEFTAAQQAKAVQGVGRALTGSGMIAIAAAGALRGWLKVTGDDDDKNKDALGKTHGLDGTQLNISAALRDLRGESAEWQAGDQLLSIGFLDPLNAQLTTGALIADDIRSEAGVTAGRVLGNSLSGALQSVLDTPVMSTFQDVATNYEYSGASTPGGKMMDAAQKYAANQLSSVIPNSLRGIAQGLDDTERNAYSSDNVWQQAIDNAKASIPGLRETLPAKTDVWGNPIKNEGGIRNFMNRNINPGNVTTYKPDAVSSEIEKISEATNTSLYPDRTAPRSLKVDGEAVSLTFEQRSMYQKAYGDAYSAAVTSLMNDKNYKAIPDSMKAEILQQAKDTATEQARDSLGIGYEVKSSAQKILEKSGAERNNALISAAVKAQHYLSPETQKQLSDVDRQFGGADYVGLSDELFNSAKEKANTYFSAVEAAKYGGELTETQKDLAGKDSKELARYFMDKAIESRYTDTNKSGTKADEYLKAYRHGELNDAMALAVLSDKEVMAYDRFGRSAKVTPEMALQAANAHAGMKDVKDEDGKVTSSAQDQFDAWLDKQNWTDDQKSAVRMGFYSDSVKTYSYLADQLRKGNIKTADAKSELATSYQAGWSKNVRDTGAKMADYIDAIVEYEDRPSSEELDDAGYSYVWQWFCDYLNTTDLTREQKYAMAISIKKNDYGEGTMKKIWNRLR